MIEDETFEIENDGIDFGPESSRKSLGKRSDAGDIEMQSIKKQSSGGRKEPTDIIEICS